jgi:chromosomal replication initiator protein
MKDFWADCLTRFEKEIPSQQFNAWIKSLRVEAFDSERRLCLIAPNGFILRWVRERYLGRVEAMSRQFFSEPITIDLIEDFTHPGLLPQQKPDGADTETVPGEVVVALPEDIDTFTNIDLPEYSKTRLNPEFTFNTLVTGRSNDLARAAAQQVAINPGSSYNPLFIYGGVGLGKTHLVQAIGNQLADQRPQARIRYIHAEAYVTDVVRAYQQKSFDEFKRYYHSLDLLLIDDIQFFSNKGRTQEEFFYAFNALVEAHKQIVITCDTYPKEIAGMEERLISRFGWGLTVAIEPPELEMRVAIVLKKAEAESVALSEDIAFFIAKHLRSNVRELEGALKKVLAFARFSGRELSLELAKEALQDILNVASRQVSVEGIQKTVAEYFKLKISDMHSKKRSRNVARPRQVAMALAKDLTQMSLPEIGEAFGNRDHTTVLHACRTIASLRKHDTSLNRDYVVLEQVLKG